MNSTRARLGLRLLALSLPAVLLVPGAAHAERIATDDAVGDVARENRDAAVSAGTTSDPADVEPDPFVPAPDNESADIIRTVVAHRANVLTVAVSVRDLVDTTSDFMVVRIRTSRRTYTLLVERRGAHTLTSLIRRRDQTCSGARTRADSTDDRIVVRVPTDCIGSPGSARVAVGLAAQVVVHDPETGDVMETYVDDAFAPDADRLDDALTYGPEVRRG